MVRLIISFLRERAGTLSALNSSRLRFENWIWARFEPTPPGECYYCRKPLAEHETRHHAECWKDNL